MNNPMTYIQNGDYLIPDLKLSQQPEKPLGKYGRMRKAYLKEHRPILYNQMLLSEKLYPHLLEIDETAQSRLEQMIPQLAKEAGCAQLFNCPVTAIRHDDDGVTIETADGEYQAKKAIVCAGTWVKDLLPELPVQPVRKVFAWYQADGRYSVKNKFPAFTGELPNGDQYYGFPAENDALKIGKHNGGQVIHSADERVPFAEVVSDGSEAFPFLRNVLPGIGCCLYGAACTYDNSPDEDFIIDTLPGHDNTLLITGLSGHGFKFASVLGEIAADFAQDKKSDFDLTPFRLSRFQ